MLDWEYIFTLFSVDTIGCHRNTVKNRCHNNNTYKTLCVCCYSIKEKKVYFINAKRLKQDFYSKFKFIFFIVYRNIIKKKTCYTVCKYSILSLETWSTAFRYP